MKTNKPTRIWVVWRTLKLIAATLRILFISKIEQQYPENLPKEGPLLIAINHFTTAEEAGAVFHCQQGYVSLLYKKELEDGGNPLTFIFGRVSKVFLRWSGFTPTRREIKETRAVDMTKEALRMGWRLLFTPERTSRNHTSLIYAKGRGTQRIAMGLDCLVAPVAVENGKGALKNGLLSYIRPLGFLPFLKFARNWRKHVIIIRYGPVFRFNDLGLNLEIDPEGERATTELMIRIGALLPVEQRGYYTGTIEKFLASDDLDVGFYKEVQSRF